MKKFITTIAIALSLGFSANAQSDAFFTQSFSEYRDAEEVLPALPYAHNLGEHQAAPLGTGILLLAGMGLAYAIRKNN